LVALGVVECKGVGHREEVKEVEEVEEVKEKMKKCRGKGVWEEKEFTTEDTESTEGEKRGRERGKEKPKTHPHKTR
jgi:hypothetical protein